MDTRMLSTSQVAEILDLSSPATIQNWLEGGHFPGASRTPDGDWRFPREEVEAVRQRIAEVAQRNAAGDLTPPDTF